MTFRYIAVSMLSFVFLLTAQYSSAAQEKSQSQKIDWQLEHEWNLSATPLDIVYSLDQKHVFILTDQHQVVIYDNTGKLEGTIPVAPGVKAIDIAPRGENLYLINADQKKFTSLAVDFILDINTKGSPFLGKKDAPVTIIEFSDFQCPYCKHTVPMLDKILKDNPDTVKLVFKNMPLRAHRYAEYAARAGIAAQEQGKFWEFYHRIFATKTLTPQVIDNIGISLKLNMKRFKVDMTSPKTEQQIIRDIRDAEEAGVTGTPTIFINGRLLRNRSIEFTQKIINEELKKEKSAK